MNNDDNYMRFAQVEKSKIIVAILSAVSLGVSLAEVSYYLFPETNGGTSLIISFPSDQIPWVYLLIGLTLLFAIGTIVIVISLRDVKLFRKRK